MNSVPVVSAIAVGAGLFGSLIGSFLNVVIHRVPQGRSVVSPASACGACGAAIRPRDNVPVLSWLMLRGRCRDCAAPISGRYPLVELGTALVFGLVAWWALKTFPESAAAGPGVAGTAGVTLALVAFLYLAAVGITLVFIDLETHTLPNRIVLPAYIVGGLLLGGAALLLGEPERIGTAAAGAGILFALYLVMAVAYPGGMGFGDVKLAGVLGLYLGWLGWAQLAVGAFAAFLLGGLYALALVIARRARMGSGVPFGPWMVAGAWFGIIAGGAVSAAYLGLFGLQ